MARFSLLTPCCCCSPLSPLVTQMLQKCCKCPQFFYRSCCAIALTATTLFFSLSSVSPHCFIVLVPRSPFTSVGTVGQSVPQRGVGFLFLCGAVVFATLRLNIRWSTSPSAVTVQKPPPVGITTPTAAGDDGDNPSPPLSPLLLSSALPALVTVAECVSASATTHTVFLVETEGAIQVLGTTVDTTPCSLPPQTTHAALILFKLHPVSI